MAFGFIRTMNSRQESIMTTFRFPSIVILAVLVLSSCGSSKQDAAHLDPPSSNQKKEIIATPLPISPNNCRVVATIVRVDNPASGLSEKDPCSKAPCSALIRIDSVLGYGSSFPKTLSTNQELQVKFAFTLSATADKMPEVKPALPGLKVKSRFIANIVGISTMGKSEPVFTIYNYDTTN